MRTGRSDAGFFGQDDVVTAVSLGWDHVAEHEWGIKSLLQDFGVGVTKRFQKKPQGLAAYKITKVPNDLVFGSLTIPYSNKPSLTVSYISNAFGIKEDPEKRIVDYMEHTFHDDELDFNFWTAWDGSSFILILEATEASTKIFKRFEEAFKKRDIAIFTSGKDNPFAGTGLTLAIFSRIPATTLVESKSAAQEEEKLRVQRDKLPAYLAWKQAKATWKEAHPGCETPWDAMSFDSVRKTDDGSLVIWLNPNHQQHLGYGWLNEQDIRDWVDGKVGTVIKSQELWDELCWMCTIRHSSLIGYELHLMNRHPAEYLLDPDQRMRNEDGSYRTGKGFPKKMLSPKVGYEPRRLTPEMIKAVEGHIKWLLLDDFKSQCSWHTDVTPATISQPRRETDERIYGFFECLRKLGLETQPGACNTPRVRENFSWWKDLLKSEAVFDFWVQNGIAYEPWVKNSYSEFKKAEYESVRAHGFHDQDEEFIPLEKKLKK